MFAQLSSFTPTSGHPGVLLASHKRGAGLASAHLAHLHRAQSDVQVGELRRTEVSPSGHSLHWTYCGKERHFPDASALRLAVFGRVTKASVWYLQVIFQQSTGAQRTRLGCDGGNVLGRKRAS